MERIPTNFTSEDLDTALERILAEPTRSARILSGLADIFAEQPFLTMGHWHLTDAMNTACYKVLHGFPAVIAADDTQRVAQALPLMRPGETAGEYSLRLRAAAGCV